MSYSHYFVLDCSIRQISNDLAGEHRNFPFGKRYPCQYASTLRDVQNTTEFF